MVTQVSQAIKKNIESPDSTREFPNGKIEFVSVGDRDFARVTLRPGWNWSIDVQPLVNTSLCEVAHFQYCISGRLAVEMSDGTRFDVGPGDVASIPPGHKAWVIGDQPCCLLDFLGMKEYAEKLEGQEPAAGAYDEGLYE